MKAVLIEGVPQFESILTINPVTQIKEVEGILCDSSRPDCHDCDYNCEECDNCDCDS